MKQTRRQRIAALKVVYEEQQRNLFAQSVLWDAKWRSAPNPFIAWKEYKADAPLRAPHLEAYHKVRNEYFDLKEGL